jgi:hypothetical protein
MKNVKNVLNKFVVSTSLVSMIIGADSASAASAETVTDSAYALAVDQTDSTIPVSGEASATTIQITVPTQLSFYIDPNSSTSFITHPGDVTSQTPAPIDLQILGLVAESNNQTKVVEPEKFTDAEWSSLGVKETNQNIALGVKFASTGETVWSPAEVDGVTPNQIAGQDRLDPMGNDSLQINAKYGFAWTELTDLNYKLYIRATLSDN